MFSLFTSVLRDAEGNRRRRGDASDAEIAALVRAATPAVAAALREAIACEALKKRQGESRDGRVRAERTVARQPEGEEAGQGRLV